MVAAADAPMSPIRICGHWLPANTVGRLLFDFVVFPLVVCVTLVRLRGDSLHPLGLIVVCAWLAVLVTTAAQKRCGGRAGRRSPMPEQIAVHVFAWTLLAVPFAYAGVLHPDAETKTWWLLAMIAGLLAARGYAARGGFDALLRQRVLVLGTGAAAAEVGQAMAMQDPVTRLVGFYQADEGRDAQVDGTHVLARETGLAMLARRLAVDEIVVALSERRAAGGSLDQLLACRLAGVRVLDVPAYFERNLRQLHLQPARTGVLIYGDGFRQGRARALVKRVFDVTAAIVLLALCWPLMLLAVILIKVADGGPAFYAQERVGQGGATFRVTKFRSMHRTAESDGIPRWAAPGDARVTRVGRVLRDMRIDELPQLWSVLAGHMSLVGPRPERPFFVEQLTREIPFYAARHSVKPGLTGWAQVRYRYGDTIEDAAQKLRYDLYYVKNQGLFLDTAILFETVGVVLRGAGAR